jgi:hypothetical protein
VRVMLTAKRAKLFELQTICGRLFVLHIAIVPILALGALERNNFASHLRLLTSIPTTG